MLKQYPDFMANEKEKLDQTSLCPKYLDGTIANKKKLRKYTQRYSNSKFEISSNIVQM